MRVMYKLCAEVQETVRLLCLLLIVILKPACACAQEPEELFAATNVHVGSQQTDSMEAHSAEDFVKAYVVIASPGEILYSALGHAALRLECSAYGLDYIYSYEGEDTRDNILRFFAGKLLMRVSAVPTKEYLRPYSKEGRGVVAYELDLPIRVKQRLWQQMDERVLESPVPYDYMNRGCAISVSRWIREAVDADSLSFAPWPKKFLRTRKEMGYDSIRNEWTNFVLTTITSGDAEYDGLPYAERITVPAELLEVLQGAAYGHHPLLEGKPVVMLIKKHEVGTPLVSPLYVTLLILLMALCNLYFHCRYVRWLLWGGQFLVSLFITYLVVLSDLPCTQWNWLLVPFNPVPLVLWHWRERISIPYAIVCVLWIMGMMACPHVIVTPAHCVLVMAMAVASLELSPLCSSLEKWMGSMINGTER